MHVAVLMPLYCPHHRQARPTRNKQITTHHQDCKGLEVDCVMGNQAVLCLAIAGASFGITISPLLYITY